VVGGKYTAGEMIAFELQPGQEIDGQLQELGKQFPGPTQEGPITIDARMAYRHGFLQPMERDPLSGLLDILHWSPKSPALSSGARGDLAVETGKQLEKQKLLPGMTTPARIEYVKDLCGGRTGEDGETLVVRIFESAAAGERPQIYLGVEGHAWTGAFRGGFFKKDLLFKKLSNERLDRLKVLINEGVGKPHEVLPTPKTRVAPPGSRKGPDQVEPVPDQGPPKPRHVTVPARALFDFGKRTLRAEAVAVLLDQLGDHPRHADPNSPFTVTGHTDSIGNPNFNLTLSKDRAVSVKGVLEPTYPNLQDKVATDGRGAAEPVEPNTVNGKDNPEGRAKNRRVEIEFVELVPRFKP